MAIDDNNKNILDYTEWLFARHKNHGGVSEIRIMKDGLAYSGYFDPEHDEDLLVALCPVTDTPRINIPWGDHPRIGEANIYVCSHPVNPALLARSYNKIVRANQTVSDGDVVCFDLFLVDVDPVRPAGISSSEKEKGKALEVINRIYNWFLSHGIKPLLGDSGNGGHLLIPTIPYPNTEDTAKKTLELLHLLDKLFSTADAKVDTSVGNAARIWKLYGTMAVKGSNIPERPHRFSSIDLSQIPPDIDLFEILKQEMATDKEQEHLPEDSSVPSSKTTESIQRKQRQVDWDQSKSIDVLKQLLDLKGIIYRTKSKDGCDIFELESCPHHTDHDEHKYECSIIINSDGKYGAHCFHNENAGWKDFKKAIGWGKNITKILKESYGEGNDKQKMPNQAEVADRIISERKSTSPLIFYRTDCYEYTEKHYERKSDTEMDCYVMNYLASHDDTRDNSTTAFCSSVIANMQGRLIVPDKVEQPYWLDHRLTNGHYIPLMNGVLNIGPTFRTIELINHCPEFFSTIVLPYSYLPEAECEKWQMFLDKVLPDKETQELLQEWFGYCLVFDNSLQKFMLFVGEGSNGKSVICAILILLLGNENVSTIPLELFEDKFALVNLLGKLANVVSEIGEIERTAEGFLKAIVGGDFMTFEQKYKPGVTARPTARLVFSTNNLPRFVDRSHGVWRRMILMPFNVVIPDDQQNPNLIEELKLELPGIFNWALAGLQRLKSRGHFVEPAGSIAAKAEYQAEMNPAGAFISGHFEVSAEGKVTCDTVYRLYRDFCEINGFTPLNSSNLGKEVKRCFKSVKKIRETSNGMRINCYCGIKPCSDANVLTVEWE